MARRYTRQRMKRRRRARQIRQAAAIMLLLLAELLAAALPTAIIALVALPLAYANRGYMAIGGEWILIMFVFCGAYSIVHNRVCDKIFGEEE